MDAPNRHLVLGTILTGLFALTLVVSAETEAPQTRVRHMLDSLLAVLQDESLQAPEQHQERRQRLHQTLSPYFDFVEMAKRSLGHHWETLTPAQQQEYIPLFSTLIQQSFVDRIAYRGERKSQSYGSVPSAIEVRQERIDPSGFVTVQTDMSYPNDRTKETVGYRLLKRGETWLIYDVMGGGASTLTNYRTQFDQIIRRESYDDLIKRLKLSYQHYESVLEKSK